MMMIIVNMKVDINEIVGITTTVAIPIVVMTIGADLEANIGRIDTEFLSKHIVVLQSNKVCFEPVHAYVVSISAHFPIVASATKQQCARDGEHAFGNGRLTRCMTINAFARPRSLTRNGLLSG